jgi:hypothetical protein
MSYQTCGSPLQVLVLGADPCVADFAALIRQFGPSLLRPTYHPSGHGLIWGNVGTVSLDANEPKFNPDGSLTIHMSHEPPAEADARANCYLCRRNRWR